MSRRSRLRRASFAAITLLAVLLSCEIVLRLLVRPSEKSYGVIWGEELPPLRLIPYAEAPPGSDRDAWHPGLVVDGEHISIGDLWGFNREDPELGYVPRENMTSLHDWWQSNNIGARARKDTTPGRSPGKRRMLVFGDSYAQASRVKQEQAWPYLLQQHAQAIEVVSLGVDGYGMAQSFLRYRRFKDRLEHDLVLLTFVPIKNLWRDVNTIRSLAKDWDHYVVMPRFVVEQDRLVRVASPYDRGDQVYEENGIVASERLKTHLREYDRFYFEAEYEVPRLVGRSVLYKIGLRAYLLNRKRQFYARVDPDSEAAEVSRRIFRAMNEEVAERGARFILVILPSHREVDMLRESRRFAESWRRLVESACRGDFPCIDLSRGLLDASPDTLDRGYDGSHFGPRANRLIAELVRQRLSSLELVERQRSGGPGDVVGDQDELRMAAVDDL